MLSVSTQPWPRVSPQPLARRRGSPRAKHGTQRWGRPGPHCPSPRARSQGMLTGRLGGTLSATLQTGKLRPWARHQQWAARLGLWVQTTSPVSVQSPLRSPLLPGAVSQCAWAMPAERPRLPCARPARPVPTTGPSGPCPVLPAFSSSSTHTCLPPASRAADSFPLDRCPHAPEGPSRPPGPKPWRPPPPPSVSLAG